METGFSFTKLDAIDNARNDLKPHNLDSLKSGRKWISHRIAVSEIIRIAPPWTGSSPASNVWGNRIERARKSGHVVAKGHGHSKMVETESLTKWLAANWQVFQSYFNLVVLSTSPTEGRSTSIGGTAIPIPSKKDLQSAYIALFQEKQALEKEVLALRRYRGKQERRREKARESGKKGGRGRSI